MAMFRTLVSKEQAKAKIMGNFERTTTKKNHFMTYSRYFGDLHDACFLKETLSKKTLSLGKCMYTGNVSLFIMLG